MELGLLKLVSQKLVIQFREESAKLKKQSNNSGDKAYSSPAPPQPLSSLPINSQMPPIVFQMIEMCLDLNSSSRPGAKHLTLYLKENTAEIITFKSEELNQEIEKAKNSSALSTPQAATAEFSKLDASKNAGIVSLKTKRQMVIDNIRKERITLSGLCLLLLVIMAILIFLIVRLTTVSNQISEITQQQAYNRHPSYSVTTGQLTLTTKSISLWPYPSPTA